MEALSHEFRIGCPCELLYANDLAIVAESLDELKMELKDWKEGLKVKRVKVITGKTKVMCSKHGAPNTKITSVEFPCGICLKGVGANSVLCLS